MQAGAEDSAKAKGGEQSPPVARLDATARESDTVLNGAASKNLTDVVAVFRKEMGEGMAALRREIGELHKGIAQVNSQMDSIRNFAAAKDKELQRLREGYDWTRQRVILNEFIDWLDALDLLEKKRKNDPAMLNAIGEIRDLVEVSLSNNSLERIRPQLGDSFADWRGRTEAAAAEVTDNAARDGKIKEVTRSGVLLRTGEGEAGEKIIRPARVKVWRFDAAAEKSPQKEAKAEAQPVSGGDKKGD
jgi:molecular chaperone GrpE (heat shock protein)